MSGQPANVEDENDLNRAYVLVMLDQNKLYTSSFTYHYSITESIDSSAVSWITSG